MADDHVRPDLPEPRRRDDDEEYDRPRRRRRRDDDDDEYNDGGVNSIIPYKNPQALTGYYVAVFSLIPCFGLALGPTALVLGTLGLRYRNRRPTAGGLAHAIVALVLGGLTTLANWGAAAVALIAALSK